MFVLLCSVSNFLAIFRIAFCPRVQWRLCPMQFLQFCGTGQVFGVQSSLATSMGSTRFDGIQLGSNCIIFLGMKDGEAFLD